tara:strand:- start:1785 stop:2309 length:525 start_codon:yes stop_codon:yes gene_type:complete
MSQITHYKGPGKIYFNKILIEIIKLAKLDQRNIQILDYGCGTKQLSKLLNKKVYNFDILEEYNEIKILDYKKYDLIVFNHVLMYLKDYEIVELFDKIYSLNKNCEIVIGLGRQNLISQILKLITFNFKAHKGTKISYLQQINIIKKFNILDYKKNIFFMTDIYYLDFKNYKKFI